MPIEVERLIATLEARLDKFEKALAKASGTSDKQFKKIEDRGKKMERTLAGLGAAGFKGLASGALGALAPILSVAAAIQGTKTALAEFGDIADNAKASGLDAEFFQGLAYQAQLGGVAIDQLSGSLAAFAKNSGLAVAGKGRMVTALKALNPELLENLRAATSQEQRIKLVADALAAEADASKKAAIATAAFGDAGAKLADIFSGGAAQIDAMQKKAQDLGLVVANDLIARADELGDEFDTTTKIVDLQLKQALVNLGPILVWLSGLAGDLGENLGGLFEKTKATADRSLQSLTDQLKELRTIQEKAASGGALSKMWAEKTDVSGRIRELEAEIFRRGDEASKRGLATLNATPPAGGDIPTLDEIETRDKAAAAAIKQAESVQQLIADLQFEQVIVGKSAEEQDILNTLRRAGVEATSAQGQEIRALIESINAEKAAHDAVNDSLEAQAELAEQVGQALTQAMRDGKVEGQELLGILVDVARQMALAGLGKLKEGGGGNIFSSLLSGLLGGFATGTANTGGRRGQVRGVVHGQEAVIPLPSGGAVPVEVKAAGAGGGKVVNNVYNYGSEKVETRQNPTGGIDVIVGAVEERIKGNMARGRYRSVGVDPGTVRR